MIGCEDREAYRQDVLLAWLARLRHLHHTCNHGLVQAIARSLWDGFLQYSWRSIEQIMFSFAASATCMQSDPGAFGEKLGADVLGRGQQALLREQVRADKSGCRFVLSP